MEIAPSIHWIGDCVGPRAGGAWCLVNRHRVQTSSGALSNWYRGLFPGDEADGLFPSSAGVKNALSYTSTPRYAFVVWCLVKHTDNLHESKVSSEQIKQTSYKPC